jgi:hypothetical protein
MSCVDGQGCSNRQDRTVHVAFPLRSRLPYVLSPPFEGSRLSRDMVIDISAKSHANVIRHRLWERDERHFQPAWRAPYS